MTRYPFDERAEVLPFVPPSARTVLDVGCGRGGFGFALRGQSVAGRTVWAVEESPDLAAEAATHYDRLLAGSYPEVLTEVDGARRSGRPGGWADPPGPGPATPVGRLFPPMGTGRDAGL